MKKLLLTLFVVFCIQSLNAQNIFLVQRDSAISIQFKDLTTQIKPVNPKEVHSKMHSVSYPKNDALETYPRITPIPLNEKRYSVSDFDSNNKYAAYFEEKEIGEVDVSIAPDFVFKDHSKTNLKYLDRAHGFFSNFINNIQQDKDGAIWMSSPNDGVGKLDGRDMIVYNDKSGLPSSKIQYVFYDSYDRLWIGSLNGICYISNQKLYVPKFDFLDSTTVLYITEDRNREIWFGTNGNGAFHLKNDTIIQHNKQSGLPGNIVRSIILDKEGNYWFGFGQNGICKFDGKYFTQFNTNHKNLNPNQVIQEDENGIWFGFFYDPILYYDGQSFFKYQFIDNKNISVNSIINDKNRILFLDYGNGLIEYSKVDKKVVKIIDFEYGMTNKNSFRAFIDNNQNIWLAHLFGGISRIDDSRFSIPDNQMMKLIGNLYSLHLHSNGDIWYLNNGRSILKEDSDQYVSYSDIIENQEMLNYVNDMETYDHENYFFTIIDFGICHTDLKKSTFYTFDNAVSFYGVEKGTNASYWFMSENAGLFKYSNGKFYNLNKKNGLLSNKLSNIHFDKNGQLWAAHLYGGLNIIRENEIATLHEEDGLSSAFVNCFFEENNNMWVGTTNGINIIYLDKTLRLDKTNGLLSDNIKSITKDSLGYYWAASPVGLSKIKWIDENYVQIENFEKNDGIHINDFSSAVLSLQDGQVMWGNTKSIVKYKPDKNRIFKRMVSIKFNDNCFADSITENYEIKNGKVEIQPNGQFIVSFTAIDWGNEAHITYQYSIISEESDTVWNDLGKGNSYQIKDNANGDYQFLAKAIIKGKETEVISLNFKVIPFWWETRLFIYIVGFISLLLGPLVFISYSLKKNKEKEKLEFLVNEKTIKLQKENILKDALVQEIHHRVKNNLQSISSLVDMQLRTIVDDSKRKTLIDTQLRIGAMALVHEMLYTNDNFSQISVKDYLNALVFSINEMVNPEKLPIQFNINSINYNLNISECISFGILTSEVISNSIKYAFGPIEKPQIDINFSIEDDNIYYSIEDNGVGLKDNENKNSGSLGMRLIDIFSRQLKAELSIENNPGVLVKLRIPLND